MKLKLSLIMGIFFILTACGSRGSQPPAPAAEKSASPEIETLNSKVILILDELELTNLDFKNFLRSKFSDLKDVLGNNQLISRLFDSFIDHSIILKASKNENISVSNKEISEYCGLNNIQLSDVTRDSIQDLLRIEKYLNMKVFANISVSNYETQKYFTQHRQDFSQKSRIELYQILLKDRDEAIKIRAELLNNPGSFETLAQEKSISQEASENGYMGSFEQGDLPKDMEAVVNSLPVNQISRVVESPFGFHIFKVASRKQGRQKYLNDVSDEIEKIILNEKMELEYSRYMNLLKKNTQKKVLKENFFFEYQDIKGE